MHMYKQVAVVVVIGSGTGGGGAVAVVVWGCNLLTRVLSVGLMGDPQGDPRKAGTCDLTSTAHPHLSGGLREHTPTHATL